MIIVVHRDKRDIEGKVIRAFEEVVASFSDGTYKPGSFSAAVRTMREIGCEHIAAALIGALSPLPAKKSVTHT